MTHNAILAFEEFELHVELAVLLKNGREIPLQRRVVELLSFLAAGHGRIISKEELIENIWHGEPIGDNNVEQHISMARRALSDTTKPHRFIVTAHRRGYRFVAPVSVIAPQGSTAPPLPSMSLTLAQELYANGRHFARLLSEGALRSAIELYNKALQLHPNGAHIYAALAHAHFLLGHSCLEPPSSAFAASRSAVDRALSLNPESAEACYVAAALRFYADLHVAAARPYVERAIEFGPAYEPAHMLRVRMHIADGDSERALSAASQGAAACHESVAMAASGAMALYFARRYDDAAERLRRICAVEPGYQLSRYFLGACNLFLGELDDARAHFCAVLSNDAVNLMARSTSHQHHATAALMYLEAQAGNAHAAFQLFEQYRSASRTYYTSHMVLAVAYAGLNRRPETEQELLLARAECDPWLPFALVEPFFRHFITDARFAELLQQVVRARAA